jgi:hypothetical protein
MSTLRKQTRANYTHISNELIDAEGLSYRARGVAVHLLSKPDNWMIKIEYLMKHGKEGKKAIRAALQELAEYGFLMRDRVLGADNRIVTVTYIADYPAYIDVGTIESRILGYEPAAKEVPDIPVSDTSVEGTSQTRHVGNGEVLVTPDKITTDEVKVNHRKNKKTAASTENPKFSDFTTHASFIAPETE